MNGGDIGQAVTGGGLTHRADQHARPAQRGGGGRIDLDIWAFRPDGGREFVERIEVFGPIADPKTWAGLDEAVARTWVTADGRRLRLARVAIDSGDGENTME
ncbi:hypothetical protein LTR94_035542, partial [Friedmanniomyces endolithicus]